MDFDFDIEIMYAEKTRLPLLDGFRLAFFVDSIEVDFHPRGIKD